MSPWMAAAVGGQRDAVDTPGLILDPDAFAHNLKLMMDALIGTKVRLRPHARSHKCPEIALRQMALGAPEHVAKKSAKPACSLMPRQTGPSSALVGPASQVDALAEAARSYRVSLDVYVGAKRCGVSPGAAATVLAEQIGASSALRFAGLHCYQGVAQHMRAPPRAASPGDRRCNANGV